MDIKFFSDILDALGKVSMALKCTTAVESEVAEFISARFRDLSMAARAPGVDPSKLSEEVRAFRDSVLNERRRLIRDESELYSIV